MNQHSLKQLLEDLAAKRITTDQAIDALSSLGLEQLDFATIDHQRAVRCGVPEVIYAAGKTPQQVVDIAKSLVDRHGFALVTRAEPEHVQAVEKSFKQLESATRRRTLLIGNPPTPTGNAIPIVSAGTSDEPVVEEALLTCKALGQNAHRINDVGVAGLHRLVHHLDKLRNANVIICIAGMEGALPSVVGGLVDCAVIAVPTSVGYGASFGGVAALLGMLCSCAAGVSVVNIDNGFGAGYTATLIQRQAGHAR